MRFPHYWRASLHVFISLLNFLFHELSICILCDLFFSIELYIPHKFICYLLVIAIKIYILLVYHLSFNLVFWCLCHTEDFHFNVDKSTCACVCVCSYVHACAYIHTDKKYRIYKHFMLRFLFFKYGTFILFFFFSPAWILYGLWNIPTSLSFDSNIPYTH